MHVGEFNGNPVKIHTVLCGDNTKPVLVLMHGYGGSGALFFKIIKALTEHFFLILVDIIGMGGSSRPDNFKHSNCMLRGGSFSPQEAIDYFVEYMEAWRKAMDNLTNFYLTGHSFGGYLVGNYALKYH